MKKEKDPRGRKPKTHEPINLSFNEVLSALGKSHYKDKKALKTQKNGDKKMKASKD